ncbi:E3 ubiquitin-protein ligase TRIM16-like [Trichomycterus rosablanca]|uniref:E3 ubiquitin-protein ligase TRIM16-like n=1 Tax=Trichomycterus rosablanca TaxID=2290929 RepID=UPI002F354F10
MAESSVLIDQDEFSCPICLSLLKDPVTILCGHSFCMGCINKCWDQDNDAGVYTCPQCREAFTPRPVLRRNNMLAELMEKLKKTKPQSDPAGDCSAGPGDVGCDFCTERKLKAVKTCLTCLASFCKIHLKPHYEVPVLKKHTLVEVISKLQKKICEQHDEVLKIYCRTDKECICSLCMLDTHKDHDTVSVASERNEKQNELEEEQRKYQQRIQEKLKKVLEIKQAMNSFKNSAQEAVSDNERFFSELIVYMKKKRSEVTQQIKDREKAELSRAERLLEQLEQEISDLERKATELQPILHSPDHIHFLQSFQSVCVSSGCDDSPSVTVNQHDLFKKVQKSLSHLHEKLKKFYTYEFKQIIPQVAAVRMILHLRDDFLGYFHHLTLDPNTAHWSLRLYNNNRVVRCINNQEQDQPPDHPEQFRYWKQVLCKQSLSGCCYWEVEWRGDVSLSVSYKGISRKEESNECRFGRNDQSWSLESFSSSLSFWHNNIQTEIKVPSCSKIGVFVDHSAGTLSFYNVSDTMTLLHRIQTTFTQPLYAGFGFRVGISFLVRLLHPLKDSSVRLCDPE